MVLTVAAGVAAALAAIVEAAVAVSEVEEVFEAVVAGASGTVGRFRSGGDFPDTLAAGFTWGGIEHRA